MLILYVFDAMRRIETARGDATETAFLDHLPPFRYDRTIPFFGGNYAFSGQLGHVPSRSGGAPFHLRGRGRERPTPRTYQASIDALAEKAGDGA